MTNVFPWYGITAKNVYMDPRNTYATIEATLSVSSAIVHVILNKQIYLKKVVSCWLPHQLTDFEKQKILLQHIRCAEQ